MYHPVTISHITGGGHTKRLSCPAHHPQAPGHTSPMHLVTDHPGTWSHITQAPGHTASRHLVTQHPGTWSHSTLRACTLAWSHQPTIMPSTSPRHLVTHHPGTWSHITLRACTLAWSHQLTTTPCTSPRHLVTQQTSCMHTGLVTPADYPSRTAHHPGVLTSTNCFPCALLPQPPRSTGPTPGDPRAGTRTPFSQSPGPRFPSWT